MEWYVVVLLAILHSVAHVTGISLSDGFILGEKGNVII
jgi:hypothetical protein